MNNKFTKGQGALEYAIILGIIMIGVLVMLQLFGLSVKALFTQTLCNIQGEQCTSFTYSNDFSSDSLDDFTVGRNYRSKPNAWEISEGRIYGDRDGTLFVDGINESDFLYSVSNPIMENRGNTYHGFTLFFRGSQNKNGRFNGYGLRIQRRPGGQNFIYFAEIINGRTVWPPISIAEVPEQYDWGNSSTASFENVSVVAQGNNFYAYINGELVLQGTDSTFSEGIIGIRNHNNSSVSYDGISIEALP